MHGVRGAHLPQEKLLLRRHPRRAAKAWARAPVQGTGPKCADATTQVAGSVVHGRSLEAKKLLDATIMQAMAGMPKARGRPPKKVRTSEDGASLAFPPSLPPHLHQPPPAMAPS